MTDSHSNFVVTIPLRTTPADRAILRTRLEAARSAYNALLGECMRRLCLMRESRQFRAARGMPKGADRTKAFRALNERFGFREYDLYQFIRCLRAGIVFHPTDKPADVATRTRSKGCVGYIGQHLDAHAVMAMGKRAFRAAERCAFGLNGRPRFHRFRETRSVEGINKHSAINWRGDRLTWGGLSIPADIDPEDVVITHGLKHPVCLTRIVRMVIRGKEQYFAQLVCKGEPYRKPQHKPSAGIVGLDIGPSTIAIVGDKGRGSLERFCNELESTEKEIRQLHRKADRQVRANNPDCFDARGRWNKGHRASRISRRMRETKIEIAELQRREAEHRKNLHGQLVHRVFSFGDDVRMEKLSYVSFQKNFGRSVKFRGPGLFVSRLKVEAIKWAASVTEFETRTTKLSQTCPGCGAVRKKDLSERWHSCPCGAGGQRDIVSGFLARFVSGNRLDAAQAQTAWARDCHLLRAASGVNNGSTEGASARDPLHLSAGRDSSHADVVINPVSAVDVVAGRKVRARATEKPGEDDERASANVKRLPLRGNENAGLAPRTG